MIAQVDFPSDDELKTMFGTVNTFEKFKVGDKTVRAAAKIVLKRARQLAPRDTKGWSKLRAKKQKASSKWDAKPLWKTIKMKVVKGQSGGYAVVGPEYGVGNKAYFDTSPKGRRVFYWGNDAGKVRLMVRNWIVQAADETRAEQLAAMKVALTEAVEQLIRG
jgi:hypothetical protein